MVTRRALLKGAAALSVAGAARGVFSPRAAGAQAAGLPMRIVNHTYRYTDADLRVAIVGTNIATGAQSYVTRDGALVPVSPSLTGPDGFADLSIPLGPGDTFVNLPRPLSGRAYVSVGRLPFRVVVDGGGRSALQYPAGWVPSDPSYGVLHDWIEFTHIDAGMFCNTTGVDMFGMPLAIDLVGNTTQTTGRLRPGGRDAIFRALAAQPGFERLVVPGLRVLAPGHGIDAGLFDPGYLAGEIDRAWATYGYRDLVVRTGADVRVGRVNGDVFDFSGGVAPIRRPSTRDVLFCDGALAAPNDGVTGPVAAVLAAALNRSTLATFPDQPVTDPSTYYRTPVTNHYARVLHEQTVDGRAYGFAFDDVADHASYIQDTAPRSITLTLTPFQ